VSELSEVSSAARRTASAEGLRDDLVLFAAVGVAYAAGSQVAFSWFGADGLGASFFPAAGVTMAALLMVDRRRWWIVLAAAGLAELTVDLWHDIDVLPSLGYVVANLTQPLVGAALLLALVSSVDLGRIHDLVRFYACAVVIAPAVGGVLGASSFVLLDGGDGWVRFATEWWVGDGLGVLVVGSAILSVRATGPKQTSMLTRATGAGVALICVLATTAVFRLDAFEFVYVPIVLLALLAFQIGTRGVALTGAAMAFVAAQSTAEGSRYWEALDITTKEGMFHLQMGLAVLIATTLALAAAIAERERIAAELARTSAEREAALERAALVESEQRARKHAESLARAASLLAATGSVDEVAQAAADSIAEWGAHTSTLYVVDGDELRLRGSVGLDDALREAYGTLPLSFDSPSAEAAREGRPVVTQRAVELDRWYPGLTAYRDVDDVQTLAAFPVVTSGAVQAVLTARMTQADWLIEQRHALMSALADQTAVALSRAKLLEQEREARRRAELEEQEAVGRQKVTAALAAAETAQGVANVVVTELIGALGGAGGSIFLLDRDTGALQIVDHASYPVDVIQRYREIRPDTRTPPADALAGRRAVLLGDADALRREYPALAADLPLDDPEYGRAWAHVPLVVGTRVIGVLVISYDDPQPFDRRQQDDLASMCGVVAQALDNALAHDEERRVSHSLQLGLLGGGLVPPEGTTLATAYRSGTEKLEVGGDWYDAFSLPDGRLALVVGDVVGHGIEAAAAMGQLRGAVRALAAAGSPAEVLDGLDLFVAELPSAAMSTVALAVLDIDSGSLSYACAGHPPPMIVPGSGAARLVWDGRSPPLGSQVAHRRPEAADRLEPGDTLVLYTDGLVERRSETVSAGLDRLVASAGAAVGLGPPRLVDELLERCLADDQPADDVCVLALLRGGQPARFVHRFPAAPAEIASLRRAVTAWLERAGVAAETRRDAVLATSEAAANAAEHAYGFDGAGIVEVEAWVADDTLDIVVRDTGRWRTQRRTVERGRGRTIIEALVPDVVFESTENGTVVHMKLSTVAEVPA
jgi:serine/threonine-protein kinase RsbW